MPVTKKSTARKTTAKKRTATKPAPQKRAGKVAAKKAGAGAVRVAKPAAKKPVVKKLAAQNSAAKKLAVKKPAVKKSAAKKSRVKKTAVAKAAVPPVLDVVLSLTIPEGAAGERLDRALLLALADRAEALGLSRARVQALIKSGHVVRASAAVSMHGGAGALNANHKVKAGEIYELTLPQAQAAEPVAQDIELNIVFEDKHLLVIDKAAGMVVHPAAGNHDGTLVNALLGHCGDSLSGIGGVARPGIVHRLDKDTSGLMVVAKHDAAHQALTRQFADRSLSRVYHAVVWGTPTPMRGEIRGDIGRHPRDRKKMAVVEHGGRDALTYYTVLEDFGGVASLVECKLATGRTHQIRVHMSHRKHPLIGDATYGGRMARGKDGIAIGAENFGRQALHALELQLIHPISSKQLVFKSKLPPDMVALLKQLRGSRVKSPK